MRRPATKTDEHEGDDHEDDEREDGELLDDAGNTVSGKLRQVFSTVPLYKSAAAMCAKAAVALKAVERSKSYELADPKADDRRVYSTACRAAEKKMRGLTPAIQCCDDKKCKKCGGKGYLTKDEVPE